MISKLASPAVQDRSRRSLQRIVAAAEMVLRREGAEGFSIAAIAEASGISVGGIYARVMGKQELYQLVKEDAMRSILDATIKKMSQRHGDARSVIDAFIDVTISTFARDERLHKALFAQGIVQTELGISGAATRSAANDHFVDALIRTEPALADQDRGWLLFGGDLIGSMTLRHLNAPVAQRVGWEVLQAQISTACNAYFAALAITRPSV